MASIRVLELRDYLLKKFKEECKEQEADTGWTTERAVHFCTELQGLDELPTHIDKSIYVVSYAVF